MDRVIVISKGTELLRIPAGDPDARSDAERGVRPAIDGQDRHGQGHLRQDPAIDETRQDTVPGRLAGRSPS